MKRFWSAMVLSFLVFVTLMASTPLRAAVDINTANESQLESLPGIGPGKAKAIIAERQANGPFKSIDDLDRVKGIGDKTIAELRAQATAGSSPPASGTTAVGQDSLLPGGRFPWGWLAAVVLAAGAIGWFVLRRRSHPAGSSEPVTRQQQPGASAPVAPRPAPASVPATTGSVPRPAGPGPASAPAVKVTQAKASAPPPAPAGQHASAAPPGGASAPPPAPAGPKRKDA